MTDKIKVKRRRAAYTRKSSEESLEQEFDSLHAQQEACVACIASQRSGGSPQPAPARVGGFSAITSRIPSSSTAPGRPRSVACPRARSRPLSSISCAVFRQPEIVAGTWKAARATDGDITEADTRTALQQLDPLWGELFPAEQARIVTLLVERVDIATDGLNVRLRVDGLDGLAREMQAGKVNATA